MVCENLRWPVTALLQVGSRFGAHFFYPEDGLPPVFDPQSRPGWVVELMNGSPEKQGDWRGRVQVLAADLLTNLGYELVDIDFPGSDENGSLRLFIDKEGGVSLDDCTHVSRMFGALLDVEDPVPGRYNLEVSSPGLNRRLRRPRDFSTRIGETIKVKLAQPLNGRRRFKGVLKAFNAESMAVTMEVDGEIFIIPLDETARCNLVYNFDR